MDELVKALGTVLSGLGLAGVVIGAQGFVIWWLLNKWQEAQEHRAIETKDITKAVVAMEAALARLVDVLRAKGNAL